MKRVAELFLTDEGRLLKREVAGEWYSVVRFDANYLAGAEEKAIEQSYQKRKTLSGMTERIEILEEEVEQKTTFIKNLIDGVTPLLRVIDSLKKRYPAGTLEEYVNPVRIHHCSMAERESFDLEGNIMGTGCKYVDERDELREALKQFCKFTRDSDLIDSAEWRQLLEWGEKLIRESA